MQIPPLYTSALGTGGNSNYASSQTAAESAKFSQILNELKNKTEAAFSLLSQDQTVIVPDYIKRAINWIRE